MVIFYSYDLISVLILVWIFSYLTFYISHLKQRYHSYIDYLDKLVRRDKRRNILCLKSYDILNYMVIFDNLMFAKKKHSYLYLEGAVNVKFFFPGNILIVASKVKNLLNSSLSKCIVS